MAVFGTGTIMGPIAGPAIGGWLTDDYSWRWIFYVNVPIGLLCALGIMVFIRPNRNVHREAFDFFGFATLSLAVGGLQLMLDRGELKDWFHSTEIWVEAIICGLGFYLFTVHTVTAGERSFLNRDLLRSINFIAGTMLMFVVGAIMSGTLALTPSMLQNLMNYPAITTGFVTAPRGLGTMVAMFLVGRMINRVDNRLIILAGFLITAISSWQMTGFSLYMGPGPVIFAGVVQGFGLGCTFVPLNIAALSTLPRHILTQGTAIRSLMRNLGGSVGISVLVATLAENTQTVHSRLVQELRPDNPLLRTPAFHMPFSLTAPSGVAALNAEVTRQASMVAYINDFHLMTIAALACLPLLLLMRPTRPVPISTPAPAAASAAADD
jgi:DHA2 family multidrug resistance protein